MLSSLTLNNTMCFNMSPLLLRKVSLDKLLKCNSDFHSQNHMKRQNRTLDRHILFSWNRQQIPNSQSTEKKMRTNLLSLVKT
jgi:hypothetical protein